MSITAGHGGRDAVDEEVPGGRSAARLVVLVVLLALALGAWTAAIILVPRLGFTGQGDRLHPRGVR
jgi:hypothetical protein